MNQEKEYLDIGLSLGSTIEQSVGILLDYKSKGILAKCEFNSHMLYSDTVDMDSAYVAITGKTKAEFDAQIKASQEEREIARQKHHNSIPKLTKQWIEEGHKVLVEKYWGSWDKCVPIRLDDLYEGMELECCLEIIKVLNMGQSFEEAKKVLESQSHSGMSFGLVLSMVESFCEKGSDFRSYVRGE